MALSFKPVALVSKHQLCRVTWQFAYKFAAAYAQVVYVSFFPRFSSVTTRPGDARAFCSADKTITVTQTRKFLIESLRLASVSIFAVSPSAASPGAS